MPHYRDNDETDVRSRYCRKILKRINLDYAWLLWGFILLSQFGGCATITAHKVPDNTAPLVANREIKENKLLDCSIRVFDPGTLPGDPEKRKGLSPEIRKAESRFVPINLKYAMQRSGYWGTVRVVPDDDIGTDVLIKGKIEHSDGERMTLTIEAVDTRNVRWFRKTYTEAITPQAYNNTEPGKRDAFQGIYNAIANDLIRYRNRLGPGDIKEIKEVARLRYAAEMAPDAFKDDLSKDSKGRFHLLHMPARNDPMLARINAIRSRDDMLVDVINGYYDSYYRNLWQPYNDWRKFRVKEMATMRKIEHQALTRQVLGIASIVGAIVLGATGNHDTVSSTSTLRDVMILGGAAAVSSGYQKKKDAEINKAAIKELDTSFTSEAKPLVLDVEGQTVRLTGSAEQQYARWRQILKQIYAKETGLPSQEPATVKAVGINSEDKMGLQ